MIELAGNLDLPQEPLGADGGGQPGLEDLDRNLTAVLQVFGEVHRRHPTATQLTLDLVAVGEGSLEAIQDVGHAGLLLEWPC